MTQNTLTLNLGENKKLKIKLFKNYLHIIFLKYNKYNIKYNNKYDSKLL